MAGIKQLSKLATGIPEVDRVLNEHVDKLNPILRTIAPPAAPAWVVPPLLNGWVSWGPPFDPCSYYKDVNNRVWIRGTVQGGTIGTALFIMPPGFRPNKAHDIPIRSNNLTTEVPGSIRIQGDGSVLALSGSNGSYGTEASFLAEH